MLTARDTEVDKIVGLEMGADDYVTKPFSPRELVARVRAVLRRSEEAPRAPAVIEIGAWVIDGGRREVTTRRARRLRPTAREFDLLWFLAENRGLVMSRAQILQAVWGYDYFGETRTVDVHVRQLRKEVGGRADRDRLGDRLQDGGLTVRRRFFWALVAVAVVTLAVGGVAAAVLVNRSVKESARSEFTRQAEATARLIEAAVRERGMMGQAPLRNLGSTLAVVEAVGGHDYVEAVLVAATGAVTVVGEAAPWPTRSPAALPAWGGGCSSRPKWRPAGRGLRPARRGGRLGKVVVVIGTDLELIAWPPVLVRLLWAVGLAVALAALLAGWLSRFLGKRLDGLSVAARGLAGGDLSARARSRERTRLPRWRWPSTRWPMISKRPAAGSGSSW